MSPGDPSEFRLVPKKQPPSDFSDEIKLNPHMPKHLRCDGCRIIAHIMYEAFSNEEKKLPSNTKNLSEWQISDIPDTVCSSEFLEYGIIEVNGIKRLKGPGLKNSGKSVGEFQTDGPWPQRVRLMCNDYVGKFGEGKSI